MDFIYDAVQALIDKYKTNNPFELCDCLGIKRYIMSFDDLQGVFGVIDGVPVICISDKLDKSSQSIVCAHELGHCILHKEIAESSCLREFGIFNMNTKVEYQANVFAAHLLIDEDELDTLMREEYDIYQISTMLGYDSNLVNLKIALMSKAGYKCSPIWEPNFTFD